jgi:hypothetical protein
VTDVNFGGVSRDPHELYAEIRDRLTDGERADLDALRDQDHKYFGHDVIGAVRRAERREAHEAIVAFAHMPGVTSFYGAVHMLAEAMRFAGKLKKHQILISLRPDAVARLAQDTFPEDT